MALMPRIELAPELSPGVVELRESAGGLLVRAESIQTAAAVLSALRRAEESPPGTARRGPRNPDGANIAALAREVLTARDQIERTVRELWPLLSPAARPRFDACLETFARHEEALIALGIALSRVGVSAERFLDVAHISEHLLEALADGDLGPADFVRLRPPV